MELSKILTDISLFKGLTEPQLDELTMIMTDQDFKRGQEIFAEGDPGVGFYVLISGLIKIYKLSMEGKEQILHIFGPGEPFAEAAVFAGSSYPAFAQALEQSRAFFFPRAAFIEMIQRNPSLAMNMMAALSFRLKKFANMIEALSLKEVPGRLASHLVFLSSQHEDEDNFTLNIGKAQLASLLGTIPETLSRILKKMNQQGFIKSKGSEIRIVDRDALEDLAIGEIKLS
ncbi:MAG: Crp/Fnr family transcriptional regulator [Proteobacteria bacterium]|nr:Crp/Fnr family transcriptional regulator [Pseudomonadota bacterium]MBU1716912.1 Crp/Fnr family transcriptional regulator [Pseudomonadota bacterium]